MNVHIDRCPPNSRYSTPYSSSVTSLIVGPVDKASASGLLSTILLMEASYGVEVYGPGGIVPDNSTGAHAGNPRCHPPNSCHMSVEVPQPSHVWLQHSQCGLQCWQNLGAG